MLETFGGHFMQILTSVVQGQTEGGTIAHGHYQGTWGNECGIHITLYVEYT